jgi:hypothetical protein
MDLGRAAKINSAGFNPKLTMKYSSYLRLNRWFQVVLALAVAGPIWATAQTNKPAPAQTSAGSEALPPAREIIDRFIKEIGGEEVFAKVQSQKMVGSVSMPAQGIRGTLNVLSKRPNKMLITVTIPGLGEIVQGYDGTTAWSINPATGPMLLEGKMLEQLREQAHFDAILHRDEDYKSMKTTAAREFEGKQTYEITLVRKSGQEVKEYYDRKTGLLHAMVMEQETPFGAVAVANIMEDYKKFGDFRFGTKITQKMGPIEQVMQIDSIEVNTVPDAAFNPPAEIKALARQSGQKKD